jgi:hypothetical protein
MLFDIGHPAHVHLFRNAMQCLMDKGHEILIAIRDKDITSNLLDLYGLSYNVASVARQGTLGMAIELLEHNWHILKLAKRYQSDLLLGTSVSISHAARLVDAQAIVFNEDDAEAVRAFTLLAYPLAHAIVTPSCLNENHGRKHITYNSYQELAYLHPNVFTPNPTILPKLGVQPGEPYYIMRFVSLQAAHDRGEAGLSLAMRRRLIKTLSNYGRVFITSETPLSEEFDPYRIRISPEDIHDALTFATMLISDSQTMTAEAAVLGTPAIRCNTFVGRISYLEELEHRYGLTYGFLPQDEDEMLEMVMELLARNGLRSEWQDKRERMLADKIDLTAWMVDFIERYPQSFYEYKEQSEGRERQ